MKLNAEILNQGPLTKRESEILKYLCEGFLRKQIAAHLCRSIKTVSAHIDNIERKLEVHSTPQIISKSVASGYVAITLKEDGKTKLLSIKRILELIG